MLIYIWYFRIYTQSIDTFNTKLSVTLTGDFIISLTWESTNLILERSSGTKYAHIYLLHKKHIYAYDSDLI